MKIFRTAILAAALLAPSVATAQFSPPPEISTQGGPVALGQVMAQPDPNNPAKVTILQAPAVPDQGGGLIQLKAFGWLEPYVDTTLQLLLMAGFSWFAKSRYSAYLDDSSRAALETFLKNRASSLVADGFVRMDGKTIDVHSPALAAEANKAGAMIPGALKRFGLTPDVLASKIVDAIPQVAAGAAIVAAAHAPDPVTVTGPDATVNTSGDVTVSGELKLGGPVLPPTSGAET